MHTAHPRVVLLGDLQQRGDAAAVAVEVKAAQVWLLLLQVWLRLRVWWVLQRHDALFREALHNVQ
eukprot:160753-Chlamydomonas_euryale.AAC.1